MYAEAGYSDREAARLIVEKNLSGFEIDPRAAAMASFAVTMKACELDSRFLRRGVTPKITVLNRVEFDNEEKSLLRKVSSNLELVDVAAHLDECGSLFKPSRKDLDDIAGDLASLASDGSFFAAAAMEKLEQLQVELQPLAERYDVVVANPPYMGGSNMNKWISSWVKDNYASAKRDLCTCFIDRGFSLANERGHISMITASSWMFISSFEEFRKSLLRRASITSMIQQSTHGYAGVTVPTTMFVLAEGTQDVTGTYIRLEDFDRPQWQEPRALEALADPNCRWRYQAKAGLFDQIPGTPIAYWLCRGLKNAFESMPLLGSVARPLQGLSTANNDRFVRLWWEVCRDDSCLQKETTNLTKKSRAKWFAFLKGGEYRRWYGNQINVLNWQHNGEELRGFEASVIRNPDEYFKPGITWTKISSAKFCARFVPEGFVFSDAGPLCIPNDEQGLYRILAYLNTTVAQKVFDIITPTLNYSNGDVAKAPISPYIAASVDVIASDCIALSKQEWDKFELSWEFGRHPLV